MKFISGVVASFALALLFSPVLASAQVEDATNSEAGTVLAEINLSGAELVQEGNQVTVSFVADNYGSKPQSDIHYGLEILKVSEDGTQELVDTVVLPEAKTILPGISGFEEINYSISNLAPDTYEVWVLAQTPGGLVVGIALAGKVTSDLTNALEIKSQSCRLVVAGSETEYLLSDGVDVAADEDLVLKCPVMNHGLAARQITPEFVTHERSVFGDLVEMTYPTVAAVEILPGEEKVMEISIPKASLPQAYDIVVTYKSATDGAISNKAIVHYVLQGQSATVQSVNFSKDTYAAGEEIELTVLWSESADTFPESRSGGTKKTEDYFVGVTVTDQTGYVCGTGEAKTGDDTLTMKIASAETCTNPTAAVVLKTASGQVLDSESVTVVPATGVVVEEFMEVEQTGPSKNMLMVIGLFALIGIVLLLRYARKNHDSHVVTDTINSLAFMLVFGAGLLASAGTAEAVTWSLTSSYEDCGHWDTGDGTCVTRTATLVSATVNTDRTTYTPGQTIYLSGTVRNHACSNLYYGISARLTGNAELTFFEGRGSGSRNISGTFRAPTVPGNYTIGLGVCHTNARNCSSASINITVANPAVAGRCSASHYRCSAGTSANNRNNATNYTWSCNGLFGGRNVSCSETKINGVCAAPRNTCAAGVPANGGQNATQYTWSCNSPNGGSNASCSAYIPPAVNLTANPPLIGPGNSSTLNWNVTHATTCNASGGTWIGPKSNTTGSDSVSPALTTTYTLSCLGLGGTTGSDTAVVTLPSGTLAATPCSIPFGGTTCNTTVSWTALNFLGAPNVLQGTTSFSSAVSGPVTRQATPDNRTFTLDDTGSGYENTVVAAVTCATGGVWVSSLGVCAEQPTITIEANPDVIRSGDTADLGVTIDSDYDLTCTLTGGINETITHRGTADPTQSYTRTTRNLTAAQIVNINCVATTIPDLGNTAETRVNVVPVIEEI